MSLTPSFEHKKNRFWHRIQGQFILVLLVLLVPTLLGQAYFFKQWYDSRRENELQTSLQVARAVANTFEAFVKDVVHQEYVIGRAITLREMSADERKWFIDDNVKLYPCFLNLLWVSPEGTILTSHRDEMRDHSVTDRQYFQDIIDGREWSVSNLIQSKSTGEPVIVIACGIRDRHGKLLGIVVAGVLAERLSEALEIERSPGGAFTLVDSAGRLVFRHPSLNLTWEERDWIKDYPRFTEVFAGKEVAESWFAPYQGKRRLIANVPVKSIGWAAGAGRTEEIAMEAVISQLSPQAFLFVVISLAAFGSALLCSRFIVKSIRRLRDQAVSLGAGERIEPVVASGSAEVVELARSLNEMAEKVNAREASLRDQREWFRVTLSSIGDAVLTTDMAGNVTFLNPVAGALTGWTFEEAAGQPVQNVFRIINEKSRASAEDIVGRVLREGCVVNLANHTALISREGVQIPIEDSAAPILDGNGNVIGVVLVFHDVTERRRAQEALREQREWLGVTLSSIGDAVIATDELGRIRFINPTAAKLTGWESEEAFGQPIENVFDIFNEQTREPCESIIGRVLREGLTVGLANHTALVSRGGSVIPIEDSAAPIKNSLGDIIGVVLVFHDVSEKRMAQRQIEEKEAQLRTVLENLTQGVVVSDMGGRFLYWNRASLEMHGYSSMEESLRLLPELANTFDLTEMDGRVIPLENWPLSRILRGENLADWAVQVQRKDFEWQRIYNYGGSLAHDCDGNPFMAIVTVSDITERKRHEKERARLAAIVDSSNDAIIGKTLSGEIINWNRASEEMYGYTAEEVMGKPISILVPDDHEDEIPGILNRISNGDTVHHFETIRKRKDGQNIQVSLTVSAVTDAEGKTIGASSIARDITQRKQAEERQTLMTNILRILSGTDDLRSKLYSSLELIRKETGFDAVGLRLRIGDDFPYFEQTGFSEEFLKEENFLCGYSSDGEIKRDAKGQAVLECTCGLVLSGRTDPTMECFTSGGSFWTNISKELLSLPSETDPRTNPRNRCIHTGYQSVGLFPVRAGQEIIGLLQLNDRNQGRFTAELIQFWEALAQNFGLAVQRDIAEESLRKSEERFRSLVEVSSQMVWVTNGQGEPIEDSTSWRTFAGVAPEKWFGWNWLDAFHPDDRERVANTWRAALSEIVPYRVEARMLHSNGEYRHVLCQAAPIMNLNGSVREWVGMNTDITERKLMEEELRRSHDELESRVRERTAELEMTNEKLVVEMEERKRATEAANIARQRFYNVLETLPVYVCLLTPDYHVPFANRVFREHFGESQGLRCFEHLFGRTEPCEVCDTFKVLSTMAPHQWEWTGPNGRQYSVFDFPFTEGDGSTLILEMGIDVTERKKAEDQLTSTVARLELINQELQEFAFVASHDLQEPLRKIQTFADVLRKKHSTSLDENGISYLSKMEKSASRMRRLINDLLQFSRVATKPEPYKPINLNELIQDVIQVFEHSLEKSSAIHTSDLPVIEADESQIKQLFQNLIGNAFKYKKKDVPLEIRVYSQKETRNHCKIVVEDNGIGFEQEYADKIFAPFQRLHSKEYEGTGMGLAISRKIVERHGGTITAKSKPGVGSTFIVNLPIKQADKGVLS